MPTIEIKLTKTGRFKTGAALRSVVERSGVSREGRETTLDVVRAGTPRVTGRMAGSWEAIGLAGGDSSTISEQAVNTAPYARKVDLTSRRNRGWVGKVISQAKVAAVARMKQSAGGIAPHLWDERAGR
jgi:hypothetical protein